MMISTASLTPIVDPGDGMPNAIPKAERSRLPFAEKLNLINFIGWDAVLTKLPLILATSLLMPALAAFFALRKYLKV